MGDQLDHHDMSMWKSSTLRSRKSSYIPKVRGCYQCSRRRVDCDGVQPTCKKCLDRNLSCSGIGIRYRFAVDVGVRGIYQRPCEQSAKVIKPPKHDGSESFALEPLTQFTHDSLIDPEMQASYSYEGYDDFACGISDELYPAGCDATVSDTACRDGNVSSMICRPSDTCSIRTFPFDSVQLTEQSLLCHFSARIAPTLVAIDDDFDGWRRLVLPVAHHDDLVKFALISASVCVPAPFGFHSVSPELAYHRVICGLRQRQDLEAEHVVGKQCIILTLLILLATATINGSPDFRSILDLLETSRKAVQSAQGVFAGELGLFLATQIPKFRGYASPYLSQYEGIAVLSQTAASNPSTSRGWDEFYTSCNMYPKLSDSMSTIYALNQKACRIYLARAQAGSAPFNLVDQVEDFKNTMAKLPAECPGEQLLVWPCFVVALESLKADHRQFLRDTLLRFQSRRTFANITKALEYLERVWATHGNPDCAKHLTMLNVFVL